MKASIVIPTCDRIEDLRRCLRLLEPQVAGVQDVEVLVSDDGKNESSRQMVTEEFPWAHWLQGPRRGPAANRNFGVDHARGDWIIFLDDDCVPGQKYIGSYIKFFNLNSDSSAILGVGPTFRTSELPSLLWEAPHNPQGKNAISCNLTIRKNDFVKVGRFDERFPVAAFEDTEFEARCRSNGFQIKPVHGANVTHPLRRRPCAKKLAKRWEGNLIFAIDQGASNFRILWNLPWHVFRVSCSRFKNQPLNGENIRAIVLFFVAWIWVLWFTPQWLKKWYSRPQSEFWRREVREKGGVPKFGF